MFDDKNWGFTFTLCGFIITIFCIFFENINGVISGYSISTFGSLVIASKIIFTDKFNPISLLPILFFVIIYGFSLAILIKFKDKIKYQIDNFKLFSIISFILLIVQFYVFYSYKNYLAIEFFITLLNIFVLITLGTILKYYTTDGFHVIRNM
uniref:Uncharacterized protein n=1 Tax=viral metagenome TaxID=1070528 RepID=A0A6C0H5N6_9ZZZZ